MNDKLERRSVAVKELRIHEPTSESNQRTIIGYASVFDTLSEELGGSLAFREKVQHGAFAESIKQDDIRALFNHDPNYVLGRNKSGTLSLEEDENGLLVSIVPPDTQWARDLVTSVSRGDITQMSFGFTVEKDSWVESDGVDLRQLEKVKLFDVSLVTYPAYTETSVSVRSVLEKRKNERTQQAEEENAKSIERQNKLQQYKEILSNEN